VAQSLVVRQDRTGTEPRFTMLETIREFALERLVESDEAGSVRRRHAEYFLDLAEQAAPHLDQVTAGTWLDRLEADHGNLRAALTWAAAPDADASSLPRLACSLWRFWWMRGHLTEGRQWLDRALARDTDAHTRLSVLDVAGQVAFYQSDYAPARRIWEEGVVVGEAIGELSTTLWLIGRLAFLASNTGDSARAEALCASSLALSRQLGDRRSRALHLRARANVAFGQGNLDLAEASWLECLMLDREHGNAVGVPHALHSLAAVATERRDFTKARMLCDESASLFGRRADRWGLAYVLNRRMRMAQLQEDLPGTAALAREELAMNRDLGYQGGIATDLESLAWVARGQGNLDRAAWLLGAAEALREAIAEPVPLRRRAEHQAELALVRSLLGEHALARAWSAGRSVSVEDAIAEALATDAAGPGADARPAPDTPTASRDQVKSDSSDAVVAGLTPREAEVLRLIAAGRTSREMAMELVVSVATVERHITHLYGKLGVRGRAEATAYALRHDLDITPT
jgi:ATP/maltotriose-dependent transcriptional regulator MalT